MSTALQTEAIPEPPIVEPAVLASPNLLLRKCACGGPAGMNDDCPECSEKRLRLQRKVSRPSDALELEADRLAEQVMRSLGRTSRAQLTPSRVQATSVSGSSGLAKATILRQACPAEKEAEHSASDAKTPAQETRAAPKAAPTTSRPGPAGLIVEDGAREVAPGQMRKSQFLDELQSGVCAGANAELAAVGRSAQGCPYIEKWIGHYRTKNGAYVERSLHKFAPEAAGIASARDYIPIVTNRIRRSVSVWATTGKITGVPEELAGEIPGGGLLGAVGGLLSGIGSAIGGLVSGIGSAVSSAASGIGRAVSGVGSMLFKSRDGGGRDENPESVYSELGAGQPLEASVKSRMEAAFGVDFSGVRVHTDAVAANLSDRVNARAFTLGEKVAFGAGEYRPGTVTGDALLAHELAHVVQQRGPVTSAISPGRESEGSLEKEADSAAFGVTAALWTGKDRTVSRLGESHVPRLRSGLALRRCGRSYSCNIDTYRRQFNSYWNDPAFNSLPTDYNPSLSSKGPRTTRAREIFNRIYNQDGAVRAAYDNNTNNTRDCIDTYSLPEGLTSVVGSGGQTVTESPHLVALRAAFEGFGKPVSGGDYPKLREAVRQAAIPLEEQERQAVENSNDWQRTINDYVRADDRRAEIRGIIATRPPAPPPPPQPAPPAAPPPSADQAQAFMDGVAINGPAAPVLANARDEQVTLTPHSTVANPSVVVDTRFTVTPADRVRERNISSDSRWPAGAADGVPFQPRIINTSDVTMTAKLELVNGVGAPARTNPIQDLQFQVRDNRLANFRNTWDINLFFNDGSGQAFWFPGAQVRYHGGAQYFNVTGRLPFGGTNPGLILFLRAQVLRGASPAFGPTSLQPFPVDQNESGRIAMPFSAPAAVPAAGDPVTVQVELIGADRSTQEGPPKTRAVTVLPEAVYTRQQAMTAAKEDDEFLHGENAGQLRSAMTARGGVAANVAEALRSGRIKISPLTARHDSAAYVAAKVNHPDPGKVGYFAGPTYTDSNSDPNSFVDVVGAAAFSRGAGDIVMNRTIDVTTNSKRPTDEIIQLTIHEAVHALDIRPDSGSLIERYKTEFRAYWMDGRFGPPQQGSCPTPPGNCRATNFDPALAPPGPKSPRARAIFNHLYGSGTYPFVKEAYDSNTGGFREQVDNYLIPDGINLIVSLRLEALRDTISHYGFFESYDSYRQRVQNAFDRTDADDKEQIRTNRAWRDLVESNVSDPARRNAIKTLLGIPL